MDFLTLAKKRHSTRKYKDTKIEKEKLDLILEAGRVAPTANNQQPIKILVIESDEAKAKLNRCAKTFDAPLVLMICANKEQAWQRSYDNMVTTDIDASIITDHMMLEATALGLGSLWICWFKPEVIKAEFNLPNNLIPINLLAIGYSDSPEKAIDRHSQTRKDINELVSYNKL